MNQSNPPSTASEYHSGSLFRPRSDSTDSLDEGSLSAHLAPGDELGGFRLIRRIAQGGMGTVWEAEDSSLRRKVALKLIRPERVHSKAIALFEREARAGGRLHHPGLVPVFSSGQARGIHFIAQELVGSGHHLARSLKELDDQQVASDSYHREVAGFIVQVADAMQSAHEAGVIHRDLKPHNILIDRHGAPRVTDFGLARIEDEATLFSQPGIVGSYSYMSPEQATGMNEGLDHRTDIFSLGVVLYEMLTGRRPFDGDTHDQVLRQIVGDDPPTPQMVRSRVPGDLSVICVKTLEKKPEHRYASMRELAADLRRFLNHEPILARPAGPIRRMRKWMVRHPTRSMSAAIGLVAVVVIAVVLVQLLQARNQAVEERQTAESEREQADIERRNVLRLSEVRRLRDLRSDAEALWPVHPDLAAPLEKWLDRAEDIIARLPQHRASLASVRARSSTPDEITSPAEVTFDRTEDAWWYETLHELVEDLTAFADRNQPDSLVVSVEGRLERSRTIAQRTILDLEDEWGEAIISIMDSPHYGGLEIDEQLGLVPLGEEPQSGLFEFWLPESGDRPERCTKDDHDHWILDGEAGIVLVLLPGGTFTMGAQKEDPGGKNFDPIARPDERPMELTLAPFFLSKYELTLGQWQRVMQTSPSYYGVNHPLSVIDGAAHPVESIDWHESREALMRLGLALPTEAQWEYGARAGTDTPWWTGRNESELAKAGNLSDQAYISTMRTTVVSHDWDDRYPLHADVGRFLPNGFGLHDVIGNVWEWCLDTIVRDPSSAREGDGLSGKRDPSSSDQRVIRGGCFGDTAVSARSAFRYGDAPTVRASLIGVRPARALE